MRLPIIDQGHSPGKKLAFWLMRRMLDPIPGPIRVLSYRRRFFGKPYAAVLQKAMRRAKEWSLGECELFSAFVSKHNQCSF